MTTAPYTAENWPIAAAMLPFGSVDSHGAPSTTPNRRSGPSICAWCARSGFTEVDPTDTWVRVGGPQPGAAGRLQGRADRVGLTIPAISTSRRSVMDPEHGKEYLAYSHRLLDAAAELGVPLVSFGFFQAFTPPRRRRCGSGWPTAGMTTSLRRPAGARPSLIRELAEHAQSNGQQITLEMYEDTYVGTADGAVRFLEEVGPRGLRPEPRHRQLRPAAPSAGAGARTCSTSCCRTPTTGT